LLTERIQKGQKFVQEAINGSLKLQSEIKNLDQLIIKHKSELPDINKLSELRAWFLNYHNYKKQISEIESELKLSTESLQKLRQEKEKVLKQKEIMEIINIDLKTASFKKITTELTLVKQKTELKINDIDEELKKINVRLSLEKYASNLKKGDSCPICGSQEHPHLIHPQKISQEENKIEKEKKDFKKLIIIIDNSIREIDKLATNFENQQNIEKNQQNKFEILSRNLKQHEKKFSWPEFQIKDEKDIEEKFTKPLP